MNEELGHPAAPSVGIFGGVEPIASAHERPIDDIVELAGVIVELRERGRGVAVCEDAGEPRLVGGFSRAYDVDQPPLTGRRPRRCRK